MNDNDGWIMKETISIEEMNELCKDTCFSKVWMEKNEYGLLND